MRDYIPDLTERYPEGFGMPDRYDREYAAWDLFARDFEREQAELRADPYIFIKGAVYPGNGVSLMDCTVLDITDDRKQVKIFTEGQAAWYDIITDEDDNCEEAMIKDGKYLRPSTRKSDLGPESVETLESADIEELEDGEPYWVSYWLQDGSQCGADVWVPDGADAFEVIESYLMRMHGLEYGGIADYGLNGISQIID